MMMVQPVLITVVVFSSYSAFGYELKPYIVLPALSLLTMLRFPLAFFPMLMIQLINMKVSFNRIKTFLLNPEVPESAMRNNVADDSVHGGPSKPPAKLLPPTAED